MNATRPQEYSYSRIRGDAAIPIREPGKVHPIQLYSIQNSLAGLTTHRSPITLFPNSLLIGLISQLILYEFRSFSPRPDPLCGGRAAPPKRRRDTHTQANFHSSIYTGGHALAGFDAQDASHNLKERGSGAFGMASCCAHVAAKL